jgi:hypothetical protein
MDVWIRNADCLDVDQRVGEMSSWRQRRGSTGRRERPVPVVECWGPPASLLSRREVVRRQTACTSRKEAGRRLFRCEADCNVHQGDGGQPGPVGALVVKERLFQGGRCVTDILKGRCQTQHRVVTVAW